MEKKGQNKFTPIILLFLGIIVVLALIPTIADNVQKLREKNVHANVTLSVADAHLAPGVNNLSFNHTYPLTFPYSQSEDWRAHTAECNVTLLNVTTFNGTLLTGDTDYTFRWSGLSGIFFANNTNAMTMNNESNRTQLTYNYCDEGYITSSAGRTVAMLILLFSVIGLVVFAVYYVWKFREW